LELGTLKVIHVTAVAISFVLFFLRGMWAIAESPLGRQRWLRIVPHVNDTVLLTAGIWMTILIQQYPGVHGWITAKVIALLVYIGLGSMALRPGRDHEQRVGYWLAAMLVFAYIVGVALTHSATFGLFS